MSTENKEQKGVSLKDAKKNYKWKIIPLDKLPEDAPVIGINN